MMTMIIMRGCCCVRTPQPNTGYVWWASILSLAIHRHHRHHHRQDDASKIRAHSSYAMMGLDECALLNVRSVCNVVRRIFGAHCAQHKRCCVHSINGHNWRKKTLNVLYLLLAKRERQTEFNDIDAGRGIQMRGDLNGRAIWGLYFYFFFVGLKIFAYTDVSIERF